MSDPTKKRIWLPVTTLEKLQVYHDSKNDGKSFTRHLEELMNDYFMLMDLKSEFERLK